MKTASFLLLGLVLTLMASGCDQGEKEQSEPGAEVEEDTVTATEPEQPPVRAEELIWVFQARGNRQCEGGGTTLEQSGTRLTDNGVDVQESRCGARTDRMYPSVCGGATGDILLHLISKDSLDAALELGFDPAAQIEYKGGDCPKGSPNPSS